MSATHDPSAPNANIPPKAGDDDAIEAMLQSGALDRYVLGDLRPDEAPAIHAFFADPRRRAFLDQLKVRLHAETGDVPNTAATYAELLRRIEVPEASSGRPRQWNATRITRRGAVAALLVIVAVIWGGIWTVRSKQTSNVDSRVTYPMTYQTAAGQRSTVRFGDGSTMILAPATVVTISADGIMVTGEAYFSVAPHAAQPFIVQTTHSVVRVLGTRFSVRQYSGEVKSQIVVDDGKIAVQGRLGRASEATPAVLAARMMAQVSDSGVVVSSGIATREYTRWTEGVLVFHGVALREAVADLARAYAVDIRIADSVLAGQHMRMEVSVADDPLPHVLDLICEAYGARYTRTGRTYVLSAGRVARPPQSTPTPARHRLTQPEPQYGR